jgi:hydrogenase maturation protease
MNKNENVILGIGNLALSDDGAGVKTVRHLLKKNPTRDSLSIIDGGNLDYSLMDILEQCKNLIIITAPKLNFAPGTVTCFQGTEMNKVLKRPQRTANETALAEILEMVRLANQYPQHCALITIEPKKVTWGNRLSSNVNRAIPVAADHALQLMGQWTGLLFTDPEADLN